MSNVVKFPTPREQAGVSMVEDMNGLLDGLMGALIAVTHSENISEIDRDAELEVLSNIFVKYFDIAAEKYPEEFSSEGDVFVKQVEEVEQEDEDQ